jgi:protein TonB
MRINLPESARQRKRSAGGTLVSTVAHGVLIAVAVAGTNIAAEPVRGRDPEVAVHFKVPVTPQPAPPEKPSTQRPLIPTDAAPVPPSVDVPPIDLAIVPTGLPPVNSRIGTVSAEEFSRAVRDSTPIGPVTLRTELFTELMVEKAVQAVSGNPAPRYPSLLARAGVEGSVSAQFVVDTTGRVEPSSIRFTRSDHDQFDRAVREVLLRSRYVPAEVGGRQVRQLVEQAFAFALKR